MSWHPWCLGLGLLLASVEHDIGASEWCWIVNLSGLGLVWLVALNSGEET